VNNRTALRTAVTTGLANAFSSLSGVQDSQYAPLAVLSVATGSYGGALELGRQRMLGTVLGAALLLVGYEGLKELPLPLGLAITLGSLRLLGGLLQLKVGYKVGGMIIVMGWLVHEGGLASWLPLRFFWTAFGVLLTLLSMRLFWPARGLDQILAAYATLLAQLQLALRQLAAGLLADALLTDGHEGEGLQPRDLAAGHDDQRAQRLPSLALRRQLQAARSLKPILLQELGTRPGRHPAALLLASLDATASRLVTLVRAMERSAPAPLPPAQLQPLHQAEGELLGAMADQLQLWEQRLRRRSPHPRGGQSLPEPPPQGMRLPSSWQQLNQRLNDPAVNQTESERLERLAVRLTLCRQAERAIREGEASWWSLVQRT
jgi:hypothetical protein